MPTETTETEAEPEHDYPRTNLRSIRVFPTGLADDPNALDFEYPQPFSYEAQIEFFERLQKELYAAWRAGYAYLTIPFRHRAPDFFSCKVIHASFVPHNEPELNPDDPWPNEDVTFPVASMGSDVRYTPADPTFD